MIVARLDIPDAYARRARYAFGELALRWGLPLRFTADRDDANVHYTADPSAAPADSPAIPFDPAVYEPATVCRGVRGGDGRWTWRRADLAVGAPPDLVGGVFRLLTYLDESQVSEDMRDRRGIFVTDALPAGRLETAATPLVEHHAAALLETIVRRQPRLAEARVPRWPEGRRLALVPSHDVDAVNLSAPLELATNLAKTVLRRRREDLGLLVAGLSTVAGRAPSPYYRFPQWREWEAERGLRSAFFVFFRPDGVRRDLNDCKSGLDGRRTDWPALRRMAADGWEFGLHPAIHVKDAESGFEAARAWLESRLGQSVAGVRHHYWALDWREPTATHRRHQRAGFRYDSSIAWRDRAGFRAGTALPYHPFDPVAGRALDLLEIPCVLMDGHVLESDIGGTRTDPGTAVRAGREVADVVAAVGGMLVTNWHQEVAFGRGHTRGYMAALGRLLEPLQGSPDVWVATPQEVCAHWTRRAEGLLRDAR